MTAAEWVSGSVERMGHFYDRSSGSIYIRGVSRNWVRCTVSLCPEWLTAACKLIYMSAVWYSAVKSVISLYCYYANIKWASSQRTHDRPSQAHQTLTPSLRDACCLIHSWSVRVHLLKFVLSSLLDASRVVGHAQWLIMGRSLNGSFWLMDHPLSVTS